MLLPYRGGDPQSQERADALRAALNNPAVPGGKQPPATLHEAMQDSCGVADGPADYATNPDYLDGFGR